MRSMMCLIIRWCRVRLTGGPPEFAAIERAPAVTAGAFFVREIITARFGRSDGLVLASLLISSYSGTECIRGACALCLPFDLIFAIKYTTGHYRCSMRLWLGLCLNGGPDPATCDPAT